MPFRIGRPFLALLVGAFLSFSSACAGSVQDAALAGDASALQDLLAAGAEVDEPGVASPLYFGSQRGHLEAAAVLIEHGADVDHLSK